MLEVSVLDEGIGMTELERQHVFDGFYESKNPDSSSMNPHGNGIGLKLCKQICQSLEGDIIVNFSQLGSGSEFVFTMKVTPV